MLNNFNLYYFSPVFYPVKSGASVFLTNFANNILKNLYCEKFTIIADFDSIDLINKDNFFLIRIFPKVYKYKNIFLKFFFYLYRDIVFFIYLFKLLFNKNKLKIVIVHSSLVSKFSLTKYIIKINKFLKKTDTKFLIDFRDNNFDYSISRNLVLYDHILCCSQNIIKKIQSINDKLILNYIPPLIENKFIFNQNNLFKKEESKFYILNPYGDKKFKNIDSLHNAIRRLNKSELKYILVSTYDKKKENINEYEINLNFEDRDSFLSILNLCDLVICCNLNEGLPRVILEAIVFKKKFIAPASVEEFGKFSHNYLFFDEYEYELDDKIVKILNKNFAYPKFDISKFSKSNIMKKYSDLFSKI